MYIGVGSVDQVSIPFREDLHSDQFDYVIKILTAEKGFPSLSGKTFIRTLSVIRLLMTATIGVSIPFRENLHSDSR